MERIGLYEWTVVLIGMGTVFVALIGLSLILSVFSLVARLRKNKAAMALAASSAATPTAGNAPAAVPVISGVTPELVAVITAAVAAASDRTSSEIRIARIAPSAPGISGLNTPVWGYANRFAARGR